jgi:formate hydrogenlyase subunit 3/multisubunit Na+/H+ antiporter MnhD subunit
LFFNNFINFTFFFSDNFQLYLFENIFSNFILLHKVLNFNLIQIYYFPFIYIFLLITVLSILFCLSYSINELIIFVFYCLIILISGYTLFFTDSLILFFLAYEMLLIPSFFILYKFAKTKKSIEAAYLMFF